MLHATLHALPLVVVLMLASFAHAQAPPHRQGVLRIETEPGATVTTEQTRHAFEFGTAVAARFWDQDYRDEAYRAKYREMLAANFNAAVFENAQKWKQAEDDRGVLQYRQADRALVWLLERDFEVRGHCIAWANPRRLPGWWLDLPSGEAELTLMARAREVTTRYAGRITDWDVNNEMVEHDGIRGKLGTGFDDYAPVKRLFDAAATGNPDAILYVNDYAVLNPNPQTDNFEAYVEQIQTLLDMGVPVGGIGVQCHFYLPLDVEQARQRLDRLAEFGLPIKITEFDYAQRPANFDGDVEIEKADKLAAFYEMAFAHPGVDGIYAWGFWPGAHWRRDAVWWTQDWEPLPAADAYRGLVYDKWWSTTEGTADDAGVYEATVTLGTHRVTVDGKSKLFEVTANGTRLLEG